MRLAARVSIAVTLSLVVLLPPWFVNPNVLVLASTPFGTLTLTRVTLMMAFFLLLWMRISVRKRLQFSSADAVAMLLFFLVLLRPDLDTSRASHWVLMVIGSYVVGRLLWDIFGVGGAVLLTTVARITGLVEAALAIITVFTGPMWDVTYHAGNIDGIFGLKPMPGVEGAFRSTGTLGHPVPLGAILVFSLACWLLSPHLPRLWRFLGASVVLLALLTTWSRGGWLAAIFVLIVWLLILQGNKFRRFATLTSLVILLLVATSAAVPSIADAIIPRLTIVSIEDNSVSHRLLMAAWSTRVWLDSATSFLFGYGPGAVAKLTAALPPSDGFPVVDNQFLAAAVELGFVGVTVVLIGYVLVPLRLLVAARGSFQRDVRQHALLALSVGVLGVSLDGVFFEFLAQEPLAFLTSASVGCLVAYVGANARVSRAGRPLSRSENHLPTIRNTEQIEGK